MKMKNNLFNAIARIRNEGEKNWRNIVFRINQEIQMGNDYGTDGKLFQTTDQVSTLYNAEVRKRRKIFKEWKKKNKKQIKALIDKLNEITKVGE